MSTSDNVQYVNLLPVYTVKSWKEVLSATTIKLKSLITRATGQQNRQDAQDKQTRKPDHVRVHDNPRLMQATRCSHTVRLCS